MPNSDGTLTKTEKEELATLGVRKNFTKASLVRPLLITKVEKLHEHFLTETEEGLSKAEKQLVDFAEIVVNEPESSRVKHLPFEELLNKTVQLNRLAYGNLQKPNSKIPKTKEASKNKTERLADFKEYRAVYFRKIQDYNPKFFKTLEQIIVLEYLLFLENEFCKDKDLKEFYHSKKEFEKRIRVKKDALETILQQLEDWKILKREVKGMPNVTWFSINHKKLDKIMSVSLNSIRNSKN